MNEKEKKPKPTERETRKELGIFSMMRFVSAISSFPALLVIKSYRKTEKAKFKKFFQISQWKKYSKPFSVPSSVM